MKPTTVTPRVVRPKDAGVHLACGQTKIYELIENGTLESYKIGKRTRLITMRSINKLLGLETDETHTAT